jgi:hypothetical protein
VEEGVKMRWFSWYEPEFDDEGVETGPGLVMMSEDDIIASYWDHWKERMDAKFGDKSVDSAPYDVMRECCIQDFLVVNWATELKEGESS